ncbi:hypothetical protein ABPG75_011873 [Micractinium tetrahymenae]
MSLLQIAEEEDGAEVQSLSQMELEDQQELQMEEAEEEGDNNEEDVLTSQHDHEDAAQGADRRAGRGPCGAAAYGASTADLEPDDTQDD